tara:strand:+ start:7702 stop:8766 length:1065 start_codon:yes stop_codon:yes gene_type:complete
MVIISDIQLPKNADGILKVSDVSTSADSDLSARTTITDPNSSTFVKTDAEGRLNILESNIEGAGADNSLNATEYPVHQVGAFDGSSYRSSKCDNKGRLETLVFGNTSADGSGDTNCLHVNANGNLLVQNAASVNMLPANAANSHVTNDPANSLAVGLRARQTIADASTETFLLCDSTGHLQVDIQNNANVKLEDLSSQLNGDTTDDPNNSIAVCLKGRQTIGSASTSTFCKVNNLGQIENPVKAKEQVDIFSAGTSVAAGATETSASLELKGSGKAHIFIKTGSTDQSGSYQLSGNGTNFYNPSTGGLLTSVGTPTSDMLVAEVETGARYIKVLYNNTGGGGANVITSAVLTYS